MPLTEIGTLDTYQTPFYGRELYPDLEGFNNLDFYSLFSTDFSAYWNPPTIGGAVIDWNALIHIKSYNSEAVQTYSGLPAKRRFGTWNYMNADMNNNQDFIYFDNHALPYARTVVVPDSTPGTLLFPPALAPLTGNRLRNITDFTSTRYLPIGTSINLNFNPTVIADVYLVYVGRCLDSDTFNGYYNQTVFVNL